MRNVTQKIEFWLPIYDYLIDFLWYTLIFSSTIVLIYAYSILYDYSIGKSRHLPNPRPRNAKGEELILKCAKETTKCRKGSSLYLLFIHERSETNTLTIGTVWIQVHPFWQTSAKKSTLENNAHGPPQLIQRREWVRGRGSRCCGRASGRGCSRRWWVRKGRCLHHGSPRNARQWGFAIERTIQGI